jgi:GMP synthase (glutamine-hydrolysing)
MEKTISRNRQLGGTNDRHSTVKRHSNVLIVDYGSQYAQLIARRVREAGVYSEILPCTAPDSKFLEINPSAIILSGGPSDVGAIGAPTLSPALLRSNVPILGICYGMQLLAHALGGTLINGQDREYGETKLRTCCPSPLWKGISPDSAFTVWMSHGNRVATLPNGFTAIAETQTIGIAAMADESRNIYALQFHPEVHHTAHGAKILQNFLFEVAKITPDWNAPSFVDGAVEKCRRTIGRGKVVLALSGGVDSTVVAALLHRAVGGQLHCIFVDHGLLRLNEAENVESVLRKYMPDLNLQIVDASDMFLGRLVGVEDPECKRKIIGHTFIEVFENEAKKLPNVRFLAQGTLYPDVIESRSANGMVIKTHHNVGGLPERMKFELIEPLRDLFKDEVRAVGEEIGLPREIVWRHPFPGPGLAIRVIGEVTPPRLEILRKADNIVQQELERFGHSSSIWQGFAILLPMRTVGVMGDARTYENVVALRVVDSVDTMTADWTRLPYDVISTISSRITGEVNGVNRVVYDVSSKPPSTIEWE